VIPWASVFNVSSAQASSEAGPAVAVFAACFLIGLPLGVVQRVQLGYQEGFQTTIWTGLGNLLGLGGVLAAIAAGAGLPWLVLAMAGGPVAAALLNGIVLFVIRRPHLRPSLSFVSGAASRELLRLGSLFLVMHVAFAVGIQSNSLVISHVVDPEAVTTYWVSMKLFMAVPLTLGLALTPFWPAYGESIARGDVLWARRALIRSTLASISVALPLIVALIVFGQRLTEVWTRGEVSPSFLLVLGLGGWALLVTIGGPVGMFLNGAGVFRFQTVCAVVMAVTSLPLSILLGRLAGVEGVVFATLITLIVFADIPALLIIPRVLRSIEHHSAVQEAGLCAPSAPAALSTE
jgi:O-antigen/teichoic acid export membrane protein